MTTPKEKQEILMQAAHKEQPLRYLAAEIGTTVATLHRIEQGKACDAVTLFKVLTWLGREDNA